MDSIKFTKFPSDPIFSHTLYPYNSWNNKYLQLSLLLMAIASINFHQICLLYPISTVLKYLLHSQKEKKKKMILTYSIFQNAPWLQFSQKILLFQVFLENKGCLSHTPRPPQVCGSPIIKLVNVYSRLLFFHAYIKYFWELRHTTQHCSWLTCLIFIFEILVIPSSSRIWDPKL